MSRLPEFLRHLEQSKEVHLKKNTDYSVEDDPLSNFHQTAYLLTWFEDCDVFHIPYVNHIGTKLSRLGNLLQKGRDKPNNESIEDTFLDLLTYVNLWWCDYERQFGTEAIRGGIRLQPSPSGGVAYQEQRDIGETKLSEGKRTTEGGSLQTEGHSRRTTPDKS